MAPPRSRRQLDGREVSATGRYDHEHDVVLRGKVYGGSPGVEVVTPLRAQGGRRRCW